MTVPVLRLWILGSFCVAGVATSLRATDRTEASANERRAKDEKSDNPLHLTADKRQAAGIVLAKATAVTLAPEVEAYGRVLDPAPLVDLLAENATSQASLAASEKELKRVSALFHNGANASAQAAEAAEASVAKDRAAVDSARLRLVASWGREFAEPSRTTALRHAMMAGAALARIDVLPGDRPGPSVESVAVRRAGEAAAVKADVLGPAAVADRQVQGTGFLVLIRDGSFPIGAALRATLPGTGEATRAFVVPRSTIVYHEGSAWVFVLGENDTFERKQVTIVRSVEGGVALQGIKANDQVVTTGAEELLAAELQISGSTEDESD